MLTSPSLGLRVLLVTPDPRDADLIIGLPDQSGIDLVPRLLAVEPGPPRAGQPGT